MKFSDIIGQQELKDMLRQSVINTRISHAQMLIGSAGLGGLPLAIAYAQYLNCTARTAEDSCGQCESCVKMQQLAHPDVHYVFPVNKSKVSTGSDSEPATSDHFIERWRSQVITTGGYFDESDWYKKIEIENKQGAINRAEANEILKKLSYKSFESEYKVVILWLPERMNVESSNTLLKIVEEPWDKTLFLMVSQAPYRIISTILSRTQHLYLKAIPTEDIASVLKKRYATTPDQAQSVARLSMGDYLKAQKLLTDREQNSESLEVLRKLLSFAAVRRHLDLFEWAEGVAAMGREAQKQFIDNGIRVLRECYMINMGAQDVIYTTGDEYDLCQKIAPYVHSDNIVALVSEFELAKAHIIQNGNSKIVFTHFALAVSKLVFKAKTI